jgi:hypothetical protein
MTLLPAAGALMPQLPALLGVTSGAAPGPLAGSAGSAAGGWDPATSARLLDALRSGRAE